jgi:hypothetical protein
MVRLLEALQRPHTAPSAPLAARAPSSAPNEALRGTFAQRPDVLTTCAVVAKASDHDRD